MECRTPGAPLKRVLGVCRDTLWVTLSSTTQCGPHRRFSGLHQMRLPVYELHIMKSKQTERVQYRFFYVVWCLLSLHNIIINTKTPGCGLLLSYLCKACQLPPLLLYHPSQSSHQPKTMKTMKESLYKVNTLLMRVVSSRYLFLLFLLFKFFLLPLREFPLEAAVFLSRLNMRSVFIDCKVGIETHITNTIQCWLINR